jgi:hypothetical protein
MMLMEILDGICKEIDAMELEAPVGEAQRRTNNGCSRAL